MSLRWVCVVAMVLAAPSRAASAPARVQIGPLGFAMTAEAGSQLVVPLARRVAVEERRSQTAITYVLHGARLRGRNDARPLVTTYFNTPIDGARLVPRGTDVHLVIALRAASPPVWRLVDRADGTATLQIDFAAGTYATPEPPDAALVPDPEAPADAPALWRHAPPAPPSAHAPHAAGRPTQTVRDDRSGLDLHRDKAGAQLEALRRERDAQRRAAQQPRRPLPTPAPLRRDPAAKAHDRARRERKRAERDAVYREIERIGNTPGGPGTATTHE